MKAFNTMYYGRLCAEGRRGAPAEERLVLFVAGDDAEAKTVVSRIIEEIGFTHLQRDDQRAAGSRDAGRYGLP